MENIYNFLERNRNWMQQKLFSGADLELVAHALAGKSLLMSDVIDVDGVVVNRTLCKTMLAITTNYEYEYWSLVL